MRVLIDLSTGKMLDYMSGDKAEPGTLVANAVVNGASADDIEEKVVSTAEYKVLLTAAQPEKTYKDKRREAFAPWGDQLDMQYWDAVNGTSTWRDHVSSVKTAHPKPE